MPSEIDRLWAGWRSEYVAGTKTARSADSGCVFCGILASGLPASEANIVWRNETTAGILNAYPYGTGHVLIMPIRHVGSLDQLNDAESSDLWRQTQNAVTALHSAYRPDGINVGINLGIAAGAGLPDHLHVHTLPRWNADTNFITSVANVRVLPEALSVTWEKLSTAWPRA